MLWRTVPGFCVSRGVQPGEWGLCSLRTGRWVCTTSVVDRKTIIVQGLLVMVSQHPLSIFAFSFGARMVCKITDGVHHVPWRMALPAPY